MCWPSDLSVGFDNWQVLTSRFGVLLQVTILQQQLPPITRPMACNRAGGTAAQYQDTIPPHLCLDFHQTRIKRQTTRDRICIDLFQWLAPAHCRHLQCLHQRHRQFPFDANLAHHQPSLQPHLTNAPPSRRQQCDSQWSQPHQTMPPSGESRTQLSPTSEQLRPALGPTLLRLGADAPQGGGSFAH
jgi:hypothetical protein